LLDRGIQVIVSLLCASELVELALRKPTSACGITSNSFHCRCPDLGAPTDTGEFIEAVHRLTALLHGGSRVAVHCRQSVGRSGLLAASLAMACGMPLQTALGTISKAWGVTVPETEAQMVWRRHLQGLL
jgi:protein-tyrosine phosphatase